MRGLGTDAKKIWDGNSRSENRAWQRLPTCTTRATVQHLRGMVAQAGEIQRRV